MFNKFFPPENRAFTRYVEKYCRAEQATDDNIIRRMRIAWCMRKATNTQSRCVVLNPLNPELNPICYLLALLGAHHFLHVSRIRVKLLTFRLLMSYIWSIHS